MPRNRRPIDRMEKRVEIIAAATESFTEAGYEDSSMAKVAALAGVTPNTIYWYFDDKDALLVSVLDGLLAEALDEMAARIENSWVDQIMWAVERLERYSKLVAVVHARAPISPTIDAWHTGFHSLMDSLLADGLAEAGVAPDDIEAATHASVFIVEGLLTHSVEQGQRRRIFELISRAH